MAITSNSTTPDHGQPGHPEARRHDQHREQGLRLLAGGPGDGRDRVGRRFEIEFRDEERTCIVLGGGPSAGDFPAEFFARFPVVAVNNGWYLYRQADALWAADKAWWAFHWEAVRQGFKGRCFGADAAQCAELGIEHRAVRFDIGLSIHWEALGSGGRPANSGAQAINLAYLAGARRILLVGFDMKPRAGKSHWFGEHPRGVARDSPYKAFIAGMSQMASDLAGERVQVLNCSADSALPFWPRLTSTQVAKICAPS